MKLANDVVEWPFLSATGVPFFSIPDWVAHFWPRVQYRDVVFRYHCIVRKAERFVWEIYRFFFFFFFKSFHLSIRLTIDNLSRERHPILRNNFKIRFFLFFFE